MEMIKSTQKHQNHRYYDHSSWESKRRKLRFLLKHIGFKFLAKIDHVEGLENVPAEGGAILFMNHIAFVDPVVLVHIVPRNIVPLSKVEAIAMPVIGSIIRLWGAIPVNRESMDRRAIHQVMGVLRAGEIILVAPEGTRHHQLQEGRGGAAYFASRSGAPIIPVTLDGTQGFPSFPLLPRWRGPGIRVRFGRPFRYRDGYDRAKGRILQQMTKESMYILAAMLPENRRGVYADLTQATTETIEWL